MSTSHPSQEPPKPFYKQWSFWFIFLYLLFIAIYTIVFILSDGKNVLLSSNELGDFLAGSFAPLAFLFLYLGYKQQGKELKQNTEALRQQATELANSVAEQKRLIKIHQQDLDHKKFQNEPHFSVSTSKFENENIQFPIYEDGMEDPVDYDCTEIGEFNLIINENLNSARNIKVINKDEEIIIKEKTVLEVNEKMEILFRYCEDDLTNLRNSIEIYENILITYSDILGNLYSKYYQINIFYKKSIEPDSFDNFGIFLKQYTYSPTPTI